MEDNLHLMRSLEEISQEKEQLKIALSNYKDVIKETEEELMLARKLDEMIKVKAQEVGLPANAIEISKAILKNEIQFNSMENKLIDDFRLVLLSLIYFSELMLYLFVLIGN
jgi:hypothetical protein